MARSTEQLKRRNEQVVKFFNELCEKHPQWRIDPLLEETGKKFFLTSRTVQHILQHHGGEAEGRNPEDKQPDLFTDIQ